ncbi:Actin-related protein 9 [Acorus calamus]|uniref:Actin-related protein 9 n=1 Tax=Acorus calamus TaxID=4465 RepID=A0AAV9CM10_ACOCL|nr:Actin-related protein 9 [Acorus calamus]
MDYLKTVVPSQLMAERGSNLIVINPGSANVRMGFAHQQIPVSVPHCIARYMSGTNDGQKKFSLQDQNLNRQATPTQHVECEKAYDMIATLMKIPFLDEESENYPFPSKMGHVDGYKSSSGRSDTIFTWTNVLETNPNSSMVAEPLDNKVSKHESLDQAKIRSGDHEYRESIFGEEALKVSPSQPYCLRCPIRRGHFNISQHYSAQQVYEDICAIWDWILIEKLHILPAARNAFSVLLVLPETFDNREIKEMLSIVLQELRFSSAVIHQESLAAAFGNGLSTACVVHMGAQVTSVICIEDGVALPATSVTLPFGGEDISRSLLWIQQHHQTWPSMHTHLLNKPIDLLMLNKLKESYCQIRDGEINAVAVVHSYEEGIGVGSHKTRLYALNVPPMGLFYPMLLIPEEYPPPPRSWFHDHEDMLEDTWHLEFPRKVDNTDGLFLGGNGGLSAWENYSVFPTRLKEEYNLGLADAITKSILSTGRIDLQRKLFTSIQLAGGVALTSGLVAAVEERVLHAIPSNEAIDIVEVLQSRSDSTYVAWKGGAILGVLDFGRDAWILREDWIRNGIHIGSGRKYKDSYFLQAQAMCYMNS